MEKVPLFRSKDVQYDNLVQTVVASLSNVKDSCDTQGCRFKAHTTDMLHVALDCIDVFEHRQRPGQFFGVFHQISNDYESFNLYLAESADGLHDWKVVSLLQENASQGKVWLSPDSNDILLAYETTFGYDGNHITIKHFRNINEFFMAEACD